ncbi:MAG: GNAT family N-acetyltransferase, partial [Hydrogenophaga sp.]|nr:GNAT family N-acetyltransferase [Hydrogenophaga sp.]
MNKKNISLYILCLLTLSPILYGMGTTPKNQKKRTLAQTCTLLQAAAQSGEINPAAPTKKTAPGEMPPRMLKIELPQKKLNSAEFKILLRLEGNTVGSIFFTYELTTRQGFIEDLDVAAEYRRKRFGSQLVYEALGDLKKMHCQEVCLCARPDEKKYMQKLIAFYEQFGFRLDTDDSVIDDNGVI